MGRPRSPSPRGSAPKIRKVMEKVVMTQAPKCTPKFTGKSRSGKASRLLRISFKKGSCQKEEFRYLLSCSRMCKIQITSQMQIRRQVCAQTHMKKKFSNYCNSLSIEWWTADAITENSVGWRDPIPSEAPSSREQVCSEWISKSAKSKRSDIRGKDLSNGLLTWRKQQGKQFGICTRTCKARNAAWFFLHKNEYKYPGSYSENQHEFFKPSPASNVSSHSMTTSKEREFMVDSGASLHVMSKSDLTPEEQEAILKSKDPSVIMSAHGNSHTTEEATVSAFDLDMFVQVQ